MEILDLIPGTHCMPSFLRPNCLVFDLDDLVSWIRSYVGRTRKYYWDGDIALVIKKLSSLKQDLAKGLPNAQVLLHDYKEEQKKKVQEIKQVCRPRLASQQTD